MTNGVLLASVFSDKGGKSDLALGCALYIQSYQSLQVHCDRVEETDLAK